VSLRPVSSLEALAEGLAAATRDTAPPLLALIDARRGQVFAELYRATTPLEPVWEPAVLEPDALLEALRRLERAPICAGDWAIKSRRALEDAGAEVPAPESGLHAVSAFHLCRLAGGVEPVAPELVRPVYLRLPDAEINKRLAEEHDRSPIGEAGGGGRKSRSRAGTGQTPGGAPRARD
jgi:tRNA threonylcarbamoyladenosine biosynthesis protein TsaB